MMRFFQLLLVLATLGLAHGPASAQVVDWAKLARGTQQLLTGATGSATTPDGSTYVALTFTDTLRLPGHTLVAAAGPSAVVKYDSAGQVSWVRQLVGISLQNGITADPVGGGVLVLGQAQAGATWGGSPVAVSSAGSFLARCSAGGTLEWVNALPLVYGALNSQSAVGLGGDIAADGLGNSYVLGCVRATTTLGGISFDSTSTFLLSTTATGSLRWVKLLQTTDSAGLSPRTSLTRLAVAGKPTGGCVVMGAFGGALYYNNSPTPSYLVPNTPRVGTLTLLASISLAGDFLWAHMPTATVNGTLTTCQLQAVGADASGNCYGTGLLGNNAMEVVKYTATGSQQWATTSSRNTFYTTGTKLAITPSGEVAALIYTYMGQSNLPATLGALQLRTPYSVVYFDAQGHPMWQVADDLGSFSNGFNWIWNVNHLRGIGLGMDALGRLYYVANVTPVTRTTGSLGPPATLLGSYTLVGTGVVVSRLNTRHNTISGAIYLDQNANGLRDAGEPLFPRQLVVQSVQGNTPFVASNGSDGYYRLWVGAGSYVLPAPQVPASYALSQPAAGSYSGSFSSYGAVDSARHFGFRPLVNQADIRVSLTPYGAVRPGFTARYRLTVQNVGTIPVASGTVSTAFDTRLSYVSSTPAASRSGNVLTWTYSSLAPFAQLDYDVTMSLPINVPMGTQLSSTATAPLAADVVPDDNSETLSQIVTAPYDPNDMTVNYAELSLAQVAAGQPLDYTIRFQNMGTDTAFTVAISDTLNFRKLNLPTMQLVAQSHNCMWSLSGTGLLTVRFLNAKLPPRNTDVLRSQGFVRFRVQPRPSLAAGEVIPNRAHIFFDYNAPVGTNTATTTVLTPTAVLNPQQALAWDAYPNPSTEVLNVAAELPTAGTVGLELLDVLGRPVQQLRVRAAAGLWQQQLGLGTLAAGRYVLRLTLPDGSRSSRVIERR